jgi:ribosomal protein L37E
MATSVADFLTTSSLRCTRCGTTNNDSPSNFTLQSQSDAPGFDSIGARPQFVRYTCNRCGQLQAGTWRQ